MYRFVATLILLGVSASTAPAAELVELKVFPKEVTLTTKRDFQSLVVQGVYDDGITRDLTSQAEWTVGDEKLVERRESRLLPKADGETTVTVQVDGKTVSVPVALSKAGKRPTGQF